MSPARLKQLRERFGDIFVQLYGSSEHGAAVTAMGKAEHRPDPAGGESHLASAGHVVPGVELLIVDRNGRPVPDGHDGEIWMRSRAICLGYLHAPDKTAAEFRRRLLEVRRLRPHRRQRLRLCPRPRQGHDPRQWPNVYPSEVEAALSARTRR